MKHKAKWLGGVGLSLALLLSLLPATAFAADTDEARIGTTDYPTLEEAFEKAKNGDTVTLLKDVTKEGPGTYMDGTDKAFYKLTGGGTITLDLNGNTLTMNKIGQMYQTTGGIELIDRSLTIRDSVGGGKITGTSRWGGGSLIYVNMKEASGGKPSTLTLESGTLSLTAEEFVSGSTDYVKQCNNSVIRVHNGGSFIMNGGSVETMATESERGDYCSGGVFVYGGTAQLNKGTVTAQGEGTTALLVYDNPGDGLTASIDLQGASVSSEDCGAQLQMGGVLNINSGSIQADGYGVINYSGTVDMKDGLISSNGCGIYNYAYFANYASVVKISDGEVRDTQGCAVYQESTVATGATASTVISGGLYSDSVEPYVIDTLDFELHDTEGFSYYPSVDDALTAAQGEKFDINQTDPAADAITVSFQDDVSKQSYDVTTNDGTLTLPVPQQQDYLFQGWVDGQGTVYNGTHTFEADTALTAQWVKLPITLTDVTVDPISVEYTGKALDDSVITGTVKDGDTLIEGTWSWVDQPTQAGTHKAQVLFTPKNTNYAPVTATVELVIRAVEVQPTPTVTPTTTPTTAPSQPGATTAPSTGGSQATDNPDTGDHSALTLWITMLALSGTLGVSAVLSALAAKRRNSAR